MRAGASKEINSKMNREFYVSIVPLILINGGFIFGYLIFLMLGKGQKKHGELKDNSDSKIIWSSLQNYWFTITEPVVRLLIGLKITPNMITIIGVMISGLAGILFANGNWGSAGWTMIAGGVFDLFDGRVARSTNTVSKRGGYLDSVMDRYSDGLILGGLAVAFRSNWLLYFIILCFIGFYSVSYTKARAEASGVKCDVGVFQRPERIFSLGLSAIFSPLFSYYLNIEAPFLIYLVVMILGVGTVATSIYRITYTMKKL